MVRVAVFSKLADVLTVALRTRLTLFCTVAEGQSHFRTRAGGFFLNLTLVCSTLDEGGIVELCIFFRKKQDAPRLRQPGDVVLLHNVVVNEHESERNLKLTLHSGTAGCAFFDSQSSSNEPYATYGVVCCIEETILTRAKEFAQLWRIEFPDYYISGKERRIDQLETATEVDVVGYVHQVDLNHDPKVLWIWDATDVKPEDIRKTDSEEALRLGSDFVEKCRSLKQPVVPDGPDPLPSYGTLVAVAILEEQRFETVPKGWIKFRNVSVVRCHFQWVVSTSRRRSNRTTILFIAPLHGWYTVGISSKNSIDS